MYDNYQQIASEIRRVMADPNCTFEERMDALGKGDPMGISSMHDYTEVVLAEIPRLSERLKRIEAQMAKGAE